MRFQHSLLNRIVQHEQESLRNPRAHGPIIETHIQEIPAPDQPDTLPTKDHYFLGRMTLADEVSYESFLTRTDNQPGIMLMQNRPISLLSAREKVPNKMVDPQ